MKEKDLMKVSIAFETIPELENRKIQFDMLLIEKVLRAHVGENKAVIISEKSIILDELLSKIPKQFKPKITSKENITYSELLKNTYNI